MTDLIRSELNRITILEHNSSPKLYGPMSDCTHAAHAHNPSCGDNFKVYFKIEKGTISGASFEGQGCAVSKASTSILAEMCVGRSVDEFYQLYQNLEAFLDDKDLPHPEIDIEDLHAFEEVRRLPIRVNCTLLSWDAAIKTVSSL